MHALSYAGTILSDIRVLVMKLITHLVLYSGVLSSLVLSSPNNVVDVGYASYRGNLTYSNVVAYLGIPYAEPPLGEQRFRATTPLNTTRISEQADGNIVDATAYPDFCVQGTTGGAQNMVLSFFAN